MKTALIIPYFGKLPRWSDLFFFSVMKNRNLDFYFFTDIDFDAKYLSIPNVFVKKISWNDYCDTISERLNIDFHPQKAYKLCDLRPFYGYVYQDLLNSYDYWGFCDIDLVFGNISDFVKSKTSAGYEVISTHGYKVSGHFCLFKNIENFRQLPFTIKHWEKLLCGVVNVGLDEIGLTKILLPEHYLLDKFIYKCRDVFFHDTEVFDKREKTFSFINNMHRILFKLIRRPHYSFQEMYTTHCAIPEKVWQSDRPEDYWIFKNGQITAFPTERDLIYLHFLFLKKNLYLHKGTFWNENEFYHVPLEYDLSFFNDKEIRIDRKGISLP